MVAIQKQQSSWLLMSTTKLLVIFLIFDLLAILCAWLWSNDIFFESRFFRLDRDRGFSENLQYIKTGIVLVLLTRAFKQLLQPVLKAWLILFWVILVDDVVGVHEEIGELLANTGYIPEMFGIGAQSIAEIVAFAAMEGVALLYVLYTTLKAPPDWQRFSIVFLLVFSPLILSGIVLDATGFVFLESLGEISSMSLILGFVHIRLKNYANVIASE